MLFIANSKTAVPPKLVFNNVELNFTQHHKHLGVTLSDDGKWHDHINNTITSCSKVLGLMRALKFKMNRKTLNQIYISYLRPILEYASAVWDGCSEFEKIKLERIQYEAARIVTGLTRSVSINNLIHEIGWMSLDDRRKMQKLCIMFKLNQGLLPDEFSNIFPDFVRNVSHYNLRNIENFSSVARRTSLFAKSFVPSATELWNSLPVDIKSCHTISTFKLKLKKLYLSPSSIPEYFVSGKRMQSVLHARIRNNCSNLNSDLYNNHLTDNPTCSCNNGIEDANHFFLICSNYNVQRFLLLRVLQNFDVNIDLLLFGNRSLTIADNQLIFKCVHHFIKDKKDLKQRAHV